MSGSSYDAIMPIIVRELSGESCAFYHAVALMEVLRCLTLIMRYPNVRHRAN